MINNDRRDELDQLRSLMDAGSSAAHGLPSGEVRAQGARRHRRRITAVTAGVVVGVVAVGGGAVAALGGLTARTEPALPAPTPSVSRSMPDEEPSQTPSREPSTPPETEPSDPPETEPSDPPETEPSGPPTIPDGFPIDAGLAKPDGDTQVKGPDEAVKGLLPAPCGEPAEQLLAKAADRLALEHAAPSGAHSHVLWLFENDQQASDALGSVAAAIGDCGPYDVGPGRSGQPATEHFRTEQTSLGDESFAALSWWESDGAPELGTYQYQFVRVGAAVALVSGYGEYNVDTKVSDDNFDAHNQMASDLAVEMAVL